MEHTERIVQAVENVAFQLETALWEHEQHDHAGEHCGRACVTALGYLAFRLGITSEGEMLLVAWHRQRFERQAHEAKKVRTA